MSGHQSEIKKASFWISQFFIIAATVLGVYLAALQGFKQAVNFDTMQRLRNTYYLQSSLKSELQSNVQIARDYVSKQKAGMAPAQAASPLNTFIWEAMKNSSTTWETPPEILTSAQKFYRYIPELQAAAGTTLGHAVVNREIEKITAQIETDTLPAIDKNLERLRTNLKGFDIE